jgi:formylmethanofuran dehydrogenase subunit E
MIELSLIALTWYITKIYYTRELKVNMPNTGNPNLIQARCNKCSQTVVTYKDNMRNPFYCMPCK